MGADEEEERVVVVVDEEEEEEDAMDDGDESEVEEAEVMIEGRVSEFGRSDLKSLSYGSTGKRTGEHTQTHICKHSRKDQLHACAYPHNE